jgi:hypothetical protein
MAAELKVNGALFQVESLKKGRFFIVPNMGLKPSPLGETFRSTTSE